MTGPRILVLQHHALEHPGIMTGALHARGARLEMLRLYDGTPVPDTLDGWDGLIVMGGPMNVWDDASHPWLPAERALVAGAIERDLPTLGVCLGSQLIAVAAGATVTRGPEPEVGWHEIRATAAAQDDPLFAGTSAFGALEWHRDVFTLPAGAVHLASSVRCPLQAFRLGRRVYGLLFHLEITPPMVTAWCHAFAGGGPLPHGDVAADFTGANTHATAIATRLFVDR